MKYALWVALKGMGIYELSKINITTNLYLPDSMSLVLSKNQLFYLADVFHMFIIPLISTLSESILLNKI